MTSVVTLRDRSGRSRPSRWSITRLIDGVRSAWREILARVGACFPPDEPQPSPPLAKAAALREGALLSEDLDAQSKMNVA